MIIVGTNSEDRPSVSTNEVAPERSIARENLVWRKVGICLAMNAVLLIVWVLLIGNSHARKDTDLSFLMLCITIVGFMSSLYFSHLGLQGMKSENDSPEQIQGGTSTFLNVVREDFRLVTKIFDGLGNGLSSHRALVLLPVAFATIYLVTAYISWDVWQDSFPSRFGTFYPGASGL